VANTPDSRLSIRDVIARTIRDLPHDTRRGFRLALAGWVLVLALQIWDSSSRPDARGLAELLSVMLGTAGIVLLGLTEALRRAEESAPDQPAVRQILTALPPLGACAAALLASAMATVVARLWLGASPVVLGVAAVYIAAFVLAIVVVRNAAQRLFEYGQREAERVVRAEAELADARLSALQTQMNPHFLFNALNTVTALIGSSPPAAERTVENLSTVLRMTLSRSQQTAGTVGDEVEFVRAYLAVESARFSDRLTVAWEIDPAAIAAHLPPLAIQPLVENAIKHGFGHRRDGGRVTIRASRDGDRLRVGVTDNGDGFPVSYEEGTGLGNLRRRLGVLFGSAASLRVESSPGLSRVSLDLPFQTHTEDRHARTDR